MQGISILDATPDGRFLAVGLADLLRDLGDRADGLTWRLDRVECLGPAADRMHQADDAGLPICTCDLIPLADGVYQVIDGYFEGFRDGHEAPWIIIRAVDGSAFDVQCDDSDLLDGLRRKYRDVIDIPT